jgi:hypothetical protein
MLNVTIAPYLLSTKPSRPLLPVTYNLSTILPNAAVYAGFSSATGVINNSKHYILGWSFNLNGEAAALNYSALSLKAIQELAQQVSTGDHQHSYETLICKVLLPTVAISVLVSAVLVEVYMKRQMQARKTELEWQREYGSPSLKKRFGMITGLY